jgi:hypothetical protein
MQRFPKNQGSKSRAGEAARKQLIRREMRFVLHQDVRRFTQQQAEPVKRPASS